MFSVRKNLTDFSRRELAVGAVAVLTVVVLIVGFSTGWTWLPPLGRWLDSFVKSPGFGALAALSAAAIAYRAATRRIEHDRSIDLEHRRDAVIAANDERWWEALMWVYDNIDSKDPVQMLRICSALESEAHNDGQRAMLAAIVADRLQGPTEEERL